MRILIADDNEPVRRCVRELLTSEASWEVCAEAVDGVEAIQKAVALRPDLVVLDISMPVSDGLAVARTLRAEAPNTRILIMSQHDPSMLLSRALPNGRAPTPALTSAGWEQICCPPPGPSPTISEGKPNSEFQPELLGSRTLRTG